MYVILFKSIQKDIQEIQKREDPLVILQMYKNPI